ncbi:UNVERIFIED_CONTAM: Transcription termination factor MT, chloroplastic [Sesamum latifolium]|uniref:Transcription termination factor MT, chloroplastic n=1 Tax=Sesamum latifolium TaxID=2727402 RepID=A0AAW2UXM9_9LAMI
MANIPLPLYQRYYVSCNSDTVAPPPLMAAPTLHRRHYSFSSYSFPSPYHSQFLKPQLLKPPQNPTKTSISISSSSILGVPLQNHRKNSRNFSATDAGKEETDEERLEEAREAVREYLERVGVSREDASHISSNCPNYLNMLIDGVDDLDDWNSWARSSSQEITGDSLEFKKKVWQMAEQKGDNGILPFLESLGLSLSSATHLARYLSSSGSNSLSLLIQKVMYLKEILFSDSDDHEVIGKNARRMMAHLSISADDEVQQTLAFFEKIQARRGGLNLLGSEHTSFRHLIESFPRLLFLPLQSRVKQIVKFLENIGVPKGCVRNILLLYPPILSYDIEEDIRPDYGRMRRYNPNEGGYFLCLKCLICNYSLALNLRLQKDGITSFSISTCYPDYYRKNAQADDLIGAKDNDLGKMLVKYPWILSASILENFEKVLGFFDEEKVPKISSSRAIKTWPHILGCSVNKLKVMVEQFGEIGITNKKLGHVIATSPQLLLRKPQEFDQVVFFFKGLGLDEEAIARTLGRCPEIFAASIDKTLEKKLEFLSNVGIPKTHLPRVIRKYPELFVCDVDRALLPRMRYLMRIGLSKKDIGSMVCRFSPLLGYSIEEVLRPKLEFLVYTMKKPVRDVVDYPRYFSYSLEKKIKPRYWVLKGRNIEFSLKEMLGKNDEEFAAEYLGVEEMLVPPS